MIFILTLDFSIGRILREKKYECTGLISEKTESLYAEHNERAEAASSSYFATTVFYNIFILSLWLRIKRRSDQGVCSWIFLHRSFLTILIMVTEHLYWKNILCGCFCFIWLCLLIAIMKRWAERCALQLYRNSLY